MAKKKTREQTTHDRKVGRLATKYKKEGYTVRASTGRWIMPDPIGTSKRIPDIVATKRGKTKIIEVETPRSLKADKKQLETFAKHAAKKSNVTFDIVVTIPKKSGKSAPKAPSRKKK